MKNQLHPALDSIVDRLKFITDSVYQNEKTYLENYIEKNPATLASYIALSQKLGQNLNLFTLQNDLKYFEMVDNALFQRFDTIAITNMLHAYVVQGKIKLQQQITENQKSLIGKQAPEISLSNAYGDTLKLSQLKGKYVLVDFWGTWCRPCRKENKNLSALYPKYRYKGFEIFQVAIERNKTDWKNTIREDKLFWKYQVSELNYMESETAKIYQVKALPANYLVNPEGIIIDQNLFGDSLQSKLAELFPPKPLPQIQNGQ
jgi:peroxiredoxin